MLTVLSYICGAFVNAAAAEVDYWNNNNLEDDNDGDLLMTFESATEEEFNRTGRAHPSVVEDARLLVVSLIIVKIA